MWVTGTQNNKLRVSTSGRAAGKLDTELGRDGGLEAQMPPVPTKAVDEQLSRCLGWNAENQRFQGSEWPLASFAYLLPSPL